MYLPMQPNDVLQTTHERPKPAECTLHITMAMGLTRQRPAFSQLTQQGVAGATGGHGRKTQMRPKQS